MEAYIPPHNEESEMSVLGSILLDSKSLVKVADFLHKEDFYFEKHQMIYEVCIDLFNSHTPIDLLTTTNKLKEKNQLKSIGGRAYIAQLTENVPTASHIYEYGMIVKNKSILRSLVIVGDKIKGLGLKEAEKIDDLLEQAEKSIFSVTQTFIRNTFSHVKDVLNMRYEEFAELHEREDKNAIQGVASGFRDLDRIMNGFKPTELIIIAARPAMGKTAFATSMAMNAALRGNKTVAIFSLEMSKEQLVDRMFASLLMVDSWKLHKGMLDDEDFARIGGVMDQLSKASIFIDDSLGNSTTELRSKIRRLKMEQGLDIIFIDYLQLMSNTSSGSFANRVQEISEISRSLKQIAREVHVPVIALSQLSRAVESRPDKQPQLSDLRESGAIEQDADAVLMLYREDYYEPDTDRKGLTDILIRKHRNGPTGKVELMFRPEQMRFYDIDRTHQGLKMKDYQMPKNTPVEIPQMEDAPFGF
jgi:replicative DNA helicase